MLSGVTSEQRQCGFVWSSTEQLCVDERLETKETEAA